MNFYLTYTCANLKGKLSINTICVVTQVIYYRILTKLTWKESLLYIKYSKYGVLIN